MGKSVTLAAASDLIIAMFTLSRKLKKRVLISIFSQKMPLSVDSTT